MFASSARQRASPRQPAQGLQGNRRQHDDRALVPPKPLRSTAARGLPLRSRSHLSAAKAGHVRTGAVRAAALACRFVSQRTTRAPSRTATIPA